MASGSGQAEKHKCPPIPAGWTNMPTPTWRPGMTVGEAKSYWQAHLNRVSKLSPMPKQRN